MGKKKRKKVINANENVNDTNFSRTKITENAEDFQRTQIVRIKRILNSENIERNKKP